MSLRISRDNTTNMLYLFVVNSSVHPTPITRMHGKGQHCGLRVLVCRTPTFLFWSCILFNVWFEKKSIFAIISIGSLMTSRVARMQLFSHNNLEQIILM